MEALSANTTLASAQAGYGNPRFQANREKRLSDEIEDYLIDEGRQKAKQLDERQIDRFS